MFEAAAQVHCWRIQNQNTMVAQQLQREQSPRSYAAASFWTEIQSARGDREVTGNFGFWGSKMAHSGWLSWSWVEPLWEMVHGRCTNQSSHDSSGEKETDGNRKNHSSSATKSARPMDNGMRSSKDPSHGKTFGECFPSIWHSWSDRFMICSLLEPICRSGG